MCVCVCVWLFIFLIIYKAETITTCWYTWGGEKSCFTITLKSRLCLSKFVGINTVTGKNVVKNIVRLGFQDEDIEFVWKKNSLSFGGNLMLICEFSKLWHKFVAHCKR